MRAPRPLNDNDVRMQTVPRDVMGFGHSSNETLQEFALRIADMEDKTLRSLDINAQEMRRLADENKALRTRITGLSSQIAALDEVEYTSEVVVNEITRRLEETHNALLSRDEYLKECEDIMEHWPVEKKNFEREKMEMMKELEKLRFQLQNVHPVAIEEYQRKIDHLERTVEGTKYALNTLQPRYEEALVASCQISNLEADIWEKQELLESQQRDLLHNQLVIEALNREKALYPPSLLFIGNLSDLRPSTGDNSSEKVVPQGSRPLQDIKQDVVDTALNQRHSVEMALLKNNERIHQEFNDKFHDILKNHTCDDLNYFAPTPVIHGAFNKSPKKIKKHASPPGFFAGWVKLEPSCILIFDLNDRHVPVHRLRAEEVHVVPNFTDLSISLNLVSPTKAQFQQHVFKLDSIKNLNGLCTALLACGFTLFSHDPDTNVHHSGNILQKQHGYLVAPTESLKTTKHRTVRTRSVNRTPTHRKSAFSTRLSSPSSSSNHLKGHKDHHRRSTLRSTGPMPLTSSHKHHLNSETVTELRSLYSDSSTISPNSTSTMHTTISTRRVHRRRNPRRSHGRNRVYVADSDAPSIHSYRQHRAPHSEKRHSFPDHQRLLHLSQAPVFIRKPFERRHSGTLLSDGNSSIGGEYIVEERYSSHQLRDKELGDFSKRNQSCSILLSNPSLIPRSRHKDQNRRHSEKYRIKRRTEKQSGSLGSSTRFSEEVSFSFDNDSNASHASHNVYDPHNIHKRHKDLEPEKHHTAYEGHKPHYARRHYKEHRVHKHPTSDEASAVSEATTLNTPRKTHGFHDPHEHHTYNEPHDYHNEKERLPEIDIHRKSRRRGQYDPTSNVKDKNALVRRRSPDRDRDRDMESDGTSYSSGKGNRPAEGSNRYIAQSSDVDDIYEITEPSQQVDTHIFKKKKKSRRSSAMNSTSSDLSTGGFMERHSHDLKKSPTAQDESTSFLSSEDQIEPHQYTRRRRRRRDRNPRQSTHHLTSTTEITPRHNRSRLLSEETSDIGSPVRGNEKSRVRGRKLRHKRAPLHYADQTVSQAVQKVNNESPDDNRRKYISSSDSMSSLFSEGQSDHESLNGMLHRRINRRSRQEGPLTGDLSWKSLLGAPRRSKHLRRKHYKPNGNETDRRSATISTTESTDFEAIRKKSPVGKPFSYDGKRDKPRSLSESPGPQRGKRKLDKGRQHNDSRDVPYRGTAPKASMNSRHNDTWEYAPLQLRNAYPHSLTDEYIDTNRSWSRSASSATLSLSLNSNSVHKYRRKHVRRARESLPRDVSSDSINGTAGRNPYYNESAIHSPTLHHVKARHQDEVYSEESVTRVSPQNRKKARKRHSPQNESTDLIALDNHRDPRTKYSPRHPQYGEHPASRNKIDPYDERAIHTDESTNQGVSLNRQNRYKPRGRNGDELTDSTLSEGQVHSRRHRSRYSSESSNHNASSDGVSKRKLRDATIGKVDRSSPNHRASSRRRRSRHTDESIDRSSSLDNPQRRTPSAVGDNESANRFAGGRTNSRGRRSRYNGQSIDRDGSLEHFRRRRRGSVSVDVFGNKRGPEGRTHSGRRGSGYNDEFVDRGSPFDQSKIRRRGASDGNEFTDSSFSEHQSNTHGRRPHYKDQPRYRKVALDSPHRRGRITANSNEFADSNGPEGRTNSRTRRSRYNDASIERGTSLDQSTNRERRGADGNKFLDRSPEGRRDSRGRRHSYNEESTYGSASLDQPIQRRRPAINVNEFAQNGKPERRTNSGRRGYRHSNESADGDRTFDHSNIRKRRDSDQNDFTERSLSEGQSSTQRRRPRYNDQSSYRNASLDSSHRRRRRSANDDEFGESSGSERLPNSRRRRSRYDDASIERGTSLDQSTNRERRGADGNKFLDRSPEGRRNSRGRRSHYNEESTYGSASLDEPVHQRRHATNVNELPQSSRAERLINSGRRGSRRNDESTDGDTTLKKSNNRGRRGADGNDSPNRSSEDRRNSRGHRSRYTESIDPDDSLDQSPGHKPYGGNEVHKSSFPERPTRSRGRHSRYEDEYPSQKASSDKANDHRQRAANGDKFIENSYPEGQTNSRRGGSRHNDDSTDGDVTLDNSNNRRPRGANGNEFPDRFSDGRINPYGHRSHYNDESTDRGESLDDPHGQKLSDGNEVKTSSFPEKRPRSRARRERYDDEYPHQKVSSNRTNDLRQRAPNGDKFTKNNYSEGQTNSLRRLSRYDDQSTDRNPSLEQSRRRTRSGVDADAFRNLSPGGRTHPRERRSHHNKKSTGRDGSLDKRYRRRRHAANADDFRDSSVHEDQRSHRGHHSRYKDEASHRDVSLDQPNSRRGLGFYNDAQIDHSMPLNGIRSHLRRRFYSDVSTDDTRLPEKTPPRLRHHYHRNGLTDSNVSLSRMPSRRMRRFYRDVSTDSIRFSNRTPSRSPNRYYTDTSIENETSLYRMPNRRKRRFYPETSSESIEFSRRTPWSWRRYHSHASTDRYPSLDRVPIHRRRRLYRNASKDSIIFSDNTPSPSHRHIYRHASTDDTVSLDKDHISRRRRFHSDEFTESSEISGTKPIHSPRGFYARTSTDDTASVDRYHIRTGDPYHADQTASLSPLSWGKRRPSDRDSSANSAASLIRRNRRRRQHHYRDESTDRMSSLGATDRQSKSSFARDTLRTRTASLSRSNARRKHPSSRDRFTHRAASLGRRRPRRRRLLHKGKYIDRAEALSRRRGRTKRSPHRERYLDKEGKFKHKSTYEGHDLNNEESTTPRAFLDRIDSPRNGYLGSTESADIVASPPLYGSSYNRDETERAFPSTPYNKSLYRTDDDIRSHRHSPSMSPRSRSISDGSVCSRLRATNKARRRYRKRGALRSDSRRLLPKNMQTTFVSSPISSAFTTSEDQERLSESLSVPSIKDKNQSLFTFVFVFNGLLGGNCQGHGGDPYRYPPYCPYMSVVLKQYTSDNFYCFNYRHPNTGYGGRHHDHRWDPRHNAEPYEEKRDESSRRFTDREERNSKKENACPTSYLCSVACPDEVGFDTSFFPKFSKDVCTTMDCMKNTVELKLKEDPSNPCAINGRDATCTVDPKKKELRIGYSFPDEKDTSTHYTTISPKYPEDFNQLLKDALGMNWRQLEYSSDFSPQNEKSEVPSSDLQKEHHLRTPEEEDKMFIVENNEFKVFKHEADEDPALVFKSDDCKIALNDGNQEVILKRNAGNNDEENFVFKLDNEDVYDAKKSDLLRNGFSLSKENAVDPDGRPLREVCIVEKGRLSMYKHYSFPGDKPVVVLNSSNVSAVASKIRKEITLIQELPDGTQEKKIVDCFSAAVWQRWYTALLFGGFIKERTPEDERTLKSLNHLTKYVFPIRFFNPGEYKGTPCIRVTEEGLNVFDSPENDKPFFTFEKDCMEVISDLNTKRFRIFRRRYTADEDRCDIMMNLASDFDRVLNELTEQKFLNQKPYPHLHIKLKGDAVHIRVRRFRLEVLKGMREKKKTSYILSGFYHVGDISETGNGFKITIRPRVKSEQLTTLLAKEELKAGRIILGNISKDIPKIEFTVKNSIAESRWRFAFFIAQMDKNPTDVPYFFYPFFLSPFSTPASQNDASFNPVTSFTTNTDMSSKESSSRTPRPERFNTVASLKTLPTQKQKEYSSEYERFRARKQPMLFNKSFNR